MTYGLGEFQQLYDFWRLAQFPAIVSANLAQAFRDLLYATSPDSRCVRGFTYPSGRDKKLTCESIQVLGQDSIE